MPPRLALGFLAFAALLAAAWPAAALDALPETVRIGRMTLDLHEIPLRLTRVELNRRAGAPMAVSIDRIDGPPGTIPLWASLRLSEAAGGWGASGVVASGQGDVVVRFAGSGLGGAAGRLEVRSEPVRFAPGGLQPSRLWPGLAAFARNVDGTVEASLDWPDGGAVLAIEGLRLDTDYGPLGPIDGRLALDRLWPPRTAEPQRLRVEGLRLAPLVDGFEVAALGAEGIIDADLLFSVTEAGRLFVEEGRLVARGPGVLRYRSAEPPAMLAGQGQGVDLLFTALADFRYDALTAILRGYLDDEMTVELHLSGSNPALYEGHPIELNVNLEAPILPLALAGRDALEMPDAVRRALDRHQ